LTNISFGRKCFRTHFNLLYMETCAYKNLRKKFN
jgi:hypothetical protein